MLSDVNSKRSVDNVSVYGDGLIKRIIRDNRMGWILHLEEIEKNPEKEFYFTDFEICSEVRISGIFNYASESLLCGLLSEPDENGLYSYSVRVKHIQKKWEFNLANYSNKGYYFHGGLIGELIAMFSVYFQARFFFKSKTSGKLTSKSRQIKDIEPFNYRKPKLAANHEMFSDQKRNWAYKGGLKKLLDNIRGIDHKYHQSLILAFYWYAEAIKETGTDNHLFYIKMVSSVEALLDSEEVPKDSINIKINDLLGKNIFSTIETDELKTWLKNRKIKSRFEQFIERYSKGFFKGGNKNAKHCYIKRSDLKLYLKRIYNARSAYLHSGKPMYISEDCRDDRKGDKSIFWDLDPTLGVLIDRRSISETEKLPRSRWFERIVNYCLLKRVDELRSE